MLDSANILASLPLPMIIFVLVAGSARALGALFGLWGLYFILGPAALIRTVLAVIISLPLMAGSSIGLADLFGEGARIAVIGLPVREFILGFAIGLLASLPFFAVLGAGILIDQYRGDFSPGLPAPESQQVGSFANLKVVMALFLFVEAGGLAILIRTIYESYALFPPQTAEFVPALAANAGDLIATVVQEVFWLLLIIAMPIMLILVLIEFGVNIIFRLAGQIKMPSVEFLMKTLVFVLAMPILVYGLARTINSAFDSAPPPLTLLEQFSGP